MNIRRLLAALCISSLWSVPSQALPLLEKPVPLPANFQGVITIYPDSDNTNQIRRYWLVPSTARIVTKPNSQVGQFGMVHSGLTLLPDGSLDPDGTRGLLTLTIQPYVDDATLNNAKKLIEDQAKKEGATSVTFNFVTPREVKGWLMVGGQPADFWGSGGQISAAGGTVEAGYVFQIRLQDSFDVRALTQAGADLASTVGARFSMKFDGLTNPCKFSVTAKFKEVYEHFKAQVSGSAWWGLVNFNAATEWQKLRGDSGVTFKNEGCSQDTLDKYYAGKIIDNLLTQLAARTGQFAPTIKPNGLPNAPGGGGLFGWSFNAGGGYEKVDEERNLEYKVDIQSRVTDEIAFGFSFPTASKELEPHLKNLSNTAKPMPTSADIAVVAAKNKACIREQVAYLKELYEAEAISKEFYQREVQRSVSGGCAVGSGPTPLVKQLIVLPLKGTAVVPGITQKNEAVLSALPAKKVVK